MAAGLLAAGIQPVAKHAPGHGRARVDSHAALPEIAAPDAPGGLHADLLPFVLNAGLPWLMSAHIRYTTWDAGRPATLSPFVLERIIRGRLGFQGVLITDDLAMGALQGTPTERAQAALAAGADLALECAGKAEANAARETIEAAATHRENLESVKKSYTGLSVAQANADREESRKVADRCNAEVDRLEKELHTAKLIKAKAFDDLRADNEALELAKRNDECIAAFEASINAATEIESPTDEQISQAEEYVESRRNAIVMHERASVSQQAKIKAEAANAEAANRAATAERLRKAAAGIDGVLSKLVGSLDSPIKIKDGRLVVTTKRGEEFYGDLSGGNRVKTAIRVVAPHIPSGSPLHIPQENFQELNTNSQREVYELCRELGIVAVTALPTNGEKLTARVYAETTKEHTNA